MFSAIRAENICDGESPDSWKNKIGCFSEVESTILTDSCQLLSIINFFTYVEQAKRYKNMQAERYLLTNKVSTNVSTNVGTSLEDLLAVNLLQSNLAPGFYTLNCYNVCTAKHCSNSSVAIIYPQSIVVVVTVYIPTL